MKIAGAWRKSSRSAGQSGNCVEARLAETPQLSDSKLAHNRPILTIDESTYAGLIEAVKNGSFNNLDRLED